MDSIRSAFSGSNTEKTDQSQQQQGSGGLMGKLNNSMGGGQAGERNEDMLDKGGISSFPFTSLRPNPAWLTVHLSMLLVSIGVDFVQERMGQGPQDNESALEQAKDEQISDFIRSQYKTATGKDFPIADKS
jgi:hypothetical protein